MTDSKTAATGRSWNDLVELHALNRSVLRSRTGLLLLLLATTIALSLRIGDLGFITESLWHEDGFFISDSALGLPSLWKPMAGYLFLYHRTVALLAGQLPLALSPFIYFAAWLLSFFSIAWVLHTRLGVARLDAPQVFALVLAIALQPTQGEAFFNLNHANFFLGIALAVYICIPSRKPASVAELLFLVLASLTGPFSVFMLPILVLQLLTLRDFPARRSTYLAVGLCGLVQAAFIFTSTRIGGTQIDLKPADWLRALASLLSFGKPSTAMLIAAVTFWSLTVVHFVRWLVEKSSGQDRALWLLPVYAAAAGTILFLVGGLAAGVNQLPVMSALDMASRYLLVPYSMAFLIAIVTTRAHRIAHVAVMLAIGAICATGFLKVDRPQRYSSTGLLEQSDMQWPAFVKLHAIKPDLVIPVNSPWPLYPPFWQAHPEKRGGTVSGGQPITLQAERHDAGTGTIYFDVGARCGASRYLGLEMDIWRERPGNATVSWGQPGSFDANRSLTRFYPAGDATLQFAFKRNAMDHAVKVEATQGVDDSSTLRSLEPFRQPLEQAGFFVPKATPPGGEFRLHETRLFCLE